MGHNWWKFKSLSTHPEECRVFRWLFHHKITDQPASVQVMLQTLLDTNCGHFLPTKHIIILHYVFGITWIIGHHTQETLCCCCAADGATNGDIISLLTTYRATVDVKLNKTKLYVYPPFLNWKSMLDSPVDILCTLCSCLAYTNKTRKTAFMLTIW